MVAFGHTAVGTLVGLGVYQYLGASDPVTGVVVAGAAGLVSHYLADLMPHGHFIKHKDFKSKVYLEIIFNLFLSIALILGLIFFQEGLSTKWWYVLFGIGGAQLPDVLDGLIYIGFFPNKGIIKTENKFHQWTHWHAIWKKGILIDGLPWEFWKRDIWQVIVGVVTLFLVVW